MLVANQAADGALHGLKIGDANQMGQEHGKHFGTSIRTAEPKWPASSSEKREKENIINC